MNRNSAAVVKRAVVKRIVVSLVLVGLAVCPTRAAEDKKAAPNHPPGFVKPEPTEVIRLWPGDAPGLVAGGKPESFENERYRNVSSPQLFVYLPPKEKSRGTALVIAAGGGYAHLAMCLHVENVVKLLNDRGIAVFGLKYRTRYGDNNVAEDALADGKRAVRIVRSRAAEWGIDPRRIGVQGYSAGGHLALNLACRFDGGDPASADPIERVSSRPDFVVLMCPWPYKQSLDEFPLGEQSPPAFIASAKDDTTAPFAFAQGIDQRLKSLGIREMLFSPETGGHGAFHVGMVEGLGGQWPEALIGWLQQIEMLTAAGASARNAEPAAEQPFLGSYIHLPAWFGEKTDEAARHRAIVENLDRFQESGLRVLMPFVTTTSGQAEYASQLIPDRVWGSWDPVEGIVREAHQRGLQVYPVMCVLACGHDRPAGVLKSHPDWALCDKGGDPLGFISPGPPEARQWVVSVLKEIAIDLHRGSSLAVVPPPRTDRRVVWTHHPCAAFAADFCGNGRFYRPLRRDPGPPAGPGLPAPAIATAPCSNPLVRWGARV